MFTTGIAIKRSVYGQTGNFQFNTNLIIDSLLGGLDIGVSGSGQDNEFVRINTFCNSGKILDNSGRFVGAYTPNVQFNISGSVSKDRYDFFIDGKPISFGSVHDTGVFNYLYIKPNNVNCQYNFFIKGEQPSLSISSITCSTGDIAGTGYITNNKSIPIRIFSGDFSNLTSDSAISLSGLVTGDLIGSGAYYVIPDGRRSFGDYNVNLRLYTNAGILNYSNLISITGDEAPIFPSLTLNGLNSIYNGQNKSYSSDAKYLFGDGLPLLASLTYISGSGDFYKDINIESYYSGDITGYIFGSGILSQYMTGLGTGIGGQLNNSGTGLASGTISGDFTYARGTCVWPYQSFVYGYATGIGYSGLGTGFHNGQITGTIIGDSGVFKYEDYYALRAENRTLDTLINSGPSAYIQSTGGIYWNPLMNLYNKFKIRNTPTTHTIFDNASFIYGYHFASPLDLKLLLNSIYGDYIDVGVAPPPPESFGAHYAVHVTGKLGSLSTFVFEADSSNQSNVIYFDQMSEAQDLGIGSKVLTSNKVTGIIQSYFNKDTSKISPYTQTHTNNIVYFTGSGYYINTGDGNIVGSGSVIDYTKTFTGCWNMLTGESFNQVDYRSSQFYNAEQDKYSNNYPSYYLNSTAFMNVTYNNPYDTNRDVVLLQVSGSGFSTGLSLYITGNY